MKERVSLSIDSDVLQELDELKEEQGKNRSEMVQFILESAFEDEDNIRWTLVELRSEIESTLEKLDNHTQNSDME